MFAFASVFGLLLDSLTNLVSAESSYSCKAFCMAETSCEGVDKISLSPRSNVDSVANRWVFHLFDRLPRLLTR